MSKRPKLSKTEVREFTGKPPGVVGVITEFLTGEYVTGCRICTQAYRQAQSKPIQGFGHELGCPRKAFMIKMFEARTMKQGWEVWLQVELSFWLARRMAMEASYGSNGYAFVREEPIYIPKGPRSQGATDLWGVPFVPSPIAALTGALPAQAPSSAPSPTDSIALAIELKCEYEPDKSRAPEPCNVRLLQDIVKVVYEGVKPEYIATPSTTGVRLTCIGVTTKEADIATFDDALQKAKQGQGDGGSMMDGQVVFYKHLFTGMSDGQNKYFPADSWVFWWEKQYP